MSSIIIKSLFKAAMLELLTDTCARQPNKLTLIILTITW